MLMHKLLERYFELRDGTLNLHVHAIKRKKKHIFTKPNESESDSVEKIIMNPI